MDKGLHGEQTQRLTRETALDSILAGRTLLGRQSSRVLLLHFQQLLPVALFLRRSPMVDAISALWLIGKGLYTQVNFIVWCDVLLKLLVGRRTGLLPKVVVDYFLVLELAKSLHQSLLKLQLQGLVPALHVQPGILVSLLLSNLSLRPSPRAVMLLDRRSNARSQHAFKFSQFPVALGQRFFLQFQAQLILKKNSKRLLVFEEPILHTLDKSSVAVLAVIFLFGLGLRNERGEARLEIGLELLEPPVDECPGVEGVVEGFLGGLESLVDVAFYFTHVVSYNMDQGIECKQEQVAISEQPLSSPTSFIKRKALPPQAPTLKMLQPLSQPLNKHFQPPLIRNYSQADDSEEEDLDSKSVPEALVYRKVDNCLVKKAGGVNYFASVFVQQARLRNLGEPLTGLNQLLRQAPYCKEGGPKFDSNFESGNLLMAWKSGEWKGGLQFDLVLQNDLNSKGFTQWFYFSVSEVPVNTTVKFNILNLVKPDSLFNYGMLPAVFSQKRLRKTGERWTRGGRDVTYTRGTLVREHSRRYYYTLSFKYEFKFEKDTVFFAHSFPYTTANYQEFIRPVLEHPFKSRFVRATPLCTTIGGHRPDLLTVTEEHLERRKTVLILCRQHAGQTPASFVLEGLLNFLTAKTKQAQFIRRYFAFKIVPFCNLDGVVIGNYRCNLSGYDPNRKWDSTSREYFPQIVAVKKLASELSREKRLKMVIDLHGHSRRMRSFFYGNPSSPVKQLSRVFPLICSRINPDLSFLHSTFVLTPDKATTARAVLGGIAGHSFVATHETSFYGTVTSQKKRHFSEEDLRKLGNDICAGIYHVLLEDYSQERKLSERTLFARTLQEIAGNKRLAEQGAEDDGSDSGPEEYALDKDDFAKIQESGEQRTLSSSTHTRIRSAKRESKCERRMNPNLRLVEMCKVLAIMPENNLALEPAYNREELRVRQLSERRTPLHGRRPVSTYKPRACNQRLQFLLENIHQELKGEYIALHSTKRYVVAGQPQHAKEMMVVRNSAGRRSSHTEQSQQLVKSNLLQLPLK